MPFIITTHPQYPSAIALVVQEGQTYPNGDDTTIERARVRAIGSLPSGATAIEYEVVPIGATDPTDFSLLQLDFVTFIATYGKAQIAPSDVASLPAQYQAAVTTQVSVKSEQQQSVQASPPA